MSPENLVSLAGGTSKNGDFHGFSAHVINHLSVFCYFWCEYLRQLYTCYESFAMTPDSLVCLAGEAPICGDVDKDRLALRDQSWDFGAVECDPILTNLFYRWRGGHGTRKCKAENGNGSQRGRSRKSPWQPNGGKENEEHCKY